MASLKINKTYLLDSPSVVSYATEELTGGQLPVSKGTLIKLLEIVRDENPYINKAYKIKYITGKGTEDETEHIRYIRPALLKSTFRQLGSGKKQSSKKKTTGKKVRKIHKGPRGGKYYISKGRKVYI